MIIATSIPLATCISHGDRVRINLHRILVLGIWGEKRAHAAARATKASGEVMLSGAAAAPTVEIPEWVASTGIVGRMRAATGRGES